MSAASLPRETQKKAPRKGRAKWGVEKTKNRQRTVRSVLVEAVIGAPALTTVASKRLPAVAEPSVTRAATPTPATSVAQTSETTTIFRWVMRSAVKSEELFMGPSPGFTRWSRLPAKRFNTQ